jgi:oligoribonuclease NrnB/cAMP/cGMP phosphodiesterase (DHH superfamily)
MDIQATIEFLKRQGYRVESDTITKEEAKRMIEEATKKAQEEALEDERIKAVSDIIRESIKQMIDLFRVPVETYFKTAFESRQASGETPAAG